MQGLDITCCNWNTFFYYISLISCPWSHTWLNEVKHLGEEEGMQRNGTDFSFATFSIGEEWLCWLGIHKALFKHMHSIIRWLLDSTAQMICPAWSSHFLAKTFWLSQIMVCYCLFIVCLFRDENIPPRQGVTYDMINCAVMEVYNPLLLISGVGSVPYIRTSAFEIQSNHNTWSVKNYHDDKQWGELQNK